MEKRELKNDCIRSARQKAVNNGGTDENPGLVAEKTVLISISSMKRHGN